MASESEKEGDFLEVKTIRNTHQRSLILDLIKKNPDHPTADEVYELARRRDPTISKGTVYRNLSFLSERGEIQKIPMPFGADHYDFNLGDHYHFVCKNCFKVVDAKIDYLEALNHASAQLPDYETERHSVMLIGLCPKCNKH